MFGRLLRKCPPPRVLFSNPTHSPFPPSSLPQQTTCFKFTGVIHSIGMHRTCSLKEKFDVFRNSKQLVLEYNKGGDGARRSQSLRYCVCSSVCMKFISIKDLQIEKRELTRLNNPVIYPNPFGHPFRSKVLTLLRRSWDNCPHRTSTIMAYTTPDDEHHNCKQIYMHM